MTRTIELPVIAGAPCNKSGRDFFTLADDMSQIADIAETLSADGHARRDCKKSNEWTGGVDFEEALTMTRAGDMGRVAPSDKYLEQFESLAPMRAAWRTIDDVSGALPNIPAYLAGTPLTMRRRARVMSEQAPLTIVVDVASSGGIDAKQLEKRGAAILALVRGLAAVRPVQLWAGVSATPSSQSKAGAWHVFARIETAPLDLARAAHFLSCPAVARSLLYGIVYKASGNEKEHGLQWPYNDSTYSRANGRAIVGRVMGGDDVFYIAPPHVNDAIVSKPDAWLADAIKTWGGVEC
jgi:hypothetical protein